jgi:hypothetical protein
MRALTIRQPWAWAIAYGGKNVENRSWRAPHWCKSIAIHAGARSGWDTDGETSPLIRREWDAATGHIVLDRKTEFMPFSAIIAVARITGCHPDIQCASRPNGPFCSPWARPDQWHWTLANVQPLPDPVPCTGRLNLWRLPAEVEAAVRRQLVDTRD